MTDQKPMSPTCGYCAPGPGFSEYPEPPCDVCVCEARCELWEAYEDEDDGCGLCEFCGQWLDDGCECDSDGEDEAGQIEDDPTVWGRDPDLAV